jgi:hypothetical protein
MRVEDSRTRMFTFNLDFAADVELINKIGNIDNYIKNIESLEAQIKEKDEEILRLKEELNKFNTEKRE